MYQPYASSSMANTSTFLKKFKISTVRGISLQSSIFHENMRNLQVKFLRSSYFAARRSI